MPSAILFSGCVVRQLTVHAQKIVHTGSRTQVDAEDLSGKKSIDLCAPECEAAKLLRKHMHGLKSKADEIAAVIDQQEAESDLQAQHGRDNNRSGQNPWTQPGKYGQEDRVCAMEGVCCCCKC